MSSKHILVVESNADDAFLIRRAFEQLPFCTSFLCRSLSEARAYLSRAGVYKDEENYAAPDAVITELRLEKESGYELLTWMRESKTLRSIPVYILSGSISPQDVAKLKGMDIKRVVEKPAGTAELGRVLSEMAQEVCGGE